MDDAAAIAIRRRSDMHEYSQVQLLQSKVPSKVG